MPTVTVIYQKKMHLDADFYLKMFFLQTWDGRISETLNFIVYFDTRLRQTSLKFHPTVPKPLFLQSLHKQSFGKVCS